MKNSQYLKQYVQSHPDNKMAWYLLGKEYVKNGQEGKANYCFNRAGSVYEAFEHSKVPAELLQEYEERLVEAGRSRDARRSRRRRALLACILLLPALIPPALAPGLAAEPAVPAASGAPEPDAPTAAGYPPGGQPADAAGAPAGLYTAVESGGALPAPGGLMRRSGAGRVAALGMKRSGKWLLWSERLPLEFTLEAAPGRIAYQSYNAAACACEPPEDAEAAAPDAAAWQRRQEELASLWSAILRFREAKGVLPATLAQLAGPFPGNWLAGTTPAMEQAFGPLTGLAAGAEAAGQPAADGLRASPAGSVPADGSAGTRVYPPYFTEPLRIVVDKETHRLAVVSGEVVLRMYPVGLGGDRTPEGTFRVTDKVKNPNGRDDGEFGSRGMELTGGEYAIHGTNEPDSIGKDESLGCIRMGREDVEELFDLVPKGTPVYIGKGGLSGAPLVPETRFAVQETEDQTNPHKQYHWLN